MPEESEDCLYLNVWTPGGDAPDGGWPVMFWLYGGNLQFGTAGLPMYSGEHIAADRGVVVVGTNYRTNGRPSHHVSGVVLTRTYSLWVPQCAWTSGWRGERGTPGSEESPEMGFGQHQVFRWRCL